MQRLARYPLLISQIEKYTNEDHPDHLLLHRSSRTAESILNATNESIRERETKERLTAISETLYVGSEAVSILSTNAHGRIRADHGMSPFAYSTAPGSD